MTMWENKRILQPCILHIYPTAFAIWCFMMSRQHRNRKKDQTWRRRKESANLKSSIWFDFTLRTVSFYHQIIISFTHTHTLQFPGHVLSHLPLHPRTSYDWFSSISLSTADTWGNSQLFQLSSDLRVSLTKKIGVTTQLSHSSCSPLTLMSISVMTNERWKNFLSSSTLLDANLSVFL